MSAKAKSKLTPEQRNATLRRVLEKIRPYGFFVVCSLIVAAVSVAAQLYIPILCGSAIDMMLGKGNVDFNGVLRIVVEIVIVAVVAAFAQWLLSVCNNRITFSVSRDLRNAALRKIQTLPLSYLDSHPSGDIVSRMVADVDTFADGLLMGFTQLFSGVLTILGTLLFMLSENVPITLVVVCITPLSLVVASFLAKRSYKYFQGQSTVRGEQTALVNEMIEGQKVVQAFGHEAESLAAFDEVNGRLQSVSLKAIFFSSMTNPATRFVNNIVYAGVGLVGAVYAVAGGITIGQLIGEHAVRPAQVKVAAVPQQVLRVGAHAAVQKGDLLVRHPHPVGRGLLFALFGDLGGGQVPAGAGIDDVAVRGVGRTGRVQLGAGTEAGVHKALRFQLFVLPGVDVRAFALVVRPVGAAGAAALVPHKTQPCKVLLQQVRVNARAALGVQILDA